MAGTGRDNLAISLLANLTREIQRQANRAGSREYSRMGHDAQETAQHMVADGVGLAALDGLLQPLLVTSVIHRVFAMGVDEDIYVRQNHAPCSFRVSNAAELSKSTPGRSPCPPTVVSRGNGCLATVGLGVILSRNVSSMNCDKSQPLS